MPENGRARDPKAARHGNAPSGLAEAAGEVEAEAAGEALGSGDGDAEAAEEKKGCKGGGSHSPRPEQSLGPTLLLTLQGSPSGR